MFLELAFSWLLENDSAFSGSPPFHIYGNLGILSQPARPPSPQKEKVQKIRFSLPPSPKNANIITNVCFAFWAISSNVFFTKKVGIAKALPISHG